MKTVLVKSVLAASLVVGGVLAAPGAAQAQTIVRVQQETPVFAGPGYGYPQVDIVSWNQPLHLYGCLREVAWCDVGYGYGYGRGWVDADDLVIDHGNNAYLLYQSRDWYALPIISFIFGDYWGQHYRNSTWYGNRGYYSNWDWRNHSHNWHDHDRHDRDDWHNHGHDDHGSHDGSHASGNGTWHNDHDRDRPPTVPTHRDGTSGNPVRTDHPRPTVPVVPPMRPPQPRPIVERPPVVHPVIHVDRPVPTTRPVPHPVVHPTPPDRPTRPVRDDDKHNADTVRPGQRQR